MTTNEPRYLSQNVDYLGFLEAKLRDLRGIATLVYELIQNADDVKDAQGNPGARRITFDLREDALLAENDGVFRNVDFKRMQTVASGGKREEAGTTGAFGIGFIAVYQITDRPEVLSSGRHWIIDPTQPPEKRIQERDAQTTGTRFRLPWAFNPQSEVRRKLRLEAVRPEQLPRFEEEIGKAISLAALFLKQIRVLELKREGELVKRVERDVVGNDILRQEGDRVLIWRVLQGSFEDEAARLRRQYGWIEAKRHSDVVVAIPDELVDSGRLFAVLPSEEDIPLPFHINADFFPSSDRKRIIFGDDYQSSWNRAAVRSAAQALARDFRELPDLLHHKGVWQLLQSVEECRQRAGKGELDRAFSAFWEELTPHLQTLPVVFTANEEWILPRQARLLESDEELDASPIFRSLDIPIVHPDLRFAFGLMRTRQIGVPLLSVQDIVQTLEEKGLDERTPLSDAPSCLQSPAAWSTLWAAVDAMLERRQTQEALEQAQETLRSCAIVLDTRHRLQRPTNLFQGDEETQSLFQGVSWMGDYGKPDKIPGRLVAPFAVADAIDFLSEMPADYWEAEWQSGELDLEALYGWFESRKSAILGKPDLVERLRDLPIWPASGHLRSLTELYIPGGFDDPLKLSALVDVEALGGRQEFLRDLGVQDLTFETYAREQVPRVLDEEPDLSVEVRRRLVQLLAQRLGEIRGSDEVKRHLEGLPLVECTDGEFRPASRVYASSGIVRAVLGEEVYMASPPDQRADAVQALYEWLGVAQEPRSKDIIRRVAQVSKDQPTRESKGIIETVFDYLVDQWPKWDDEQKQPYERLKDRAWLPGTSDDTRWYRPDELYAIFRAYLFESQGNFLAFPRRMQDRAGGSTGLIVFLGIQRDPTAQLATRHLLFCSERGESINREVYRFLNEHADNTAIAKLRGRACLLLADGNYYRPDQVYWSEHPFGPYRHQLDPELRQYSALFDRLGVRERPEERDFVRVLIEISERHEQSHSPLDDQTRAVVMKCWEELSTALEEERIAVKDLEELQEKLVVPDPRPQTMLAKPEHLFFEDRAGLASQFGGFLKYSVIARPQGAWRAMEAVGVRRLGQAAELELLEIGDPVEDAVIAERVDHRRTLMARVIESERASGAEGLNLDAVDQLAFQRTPDLLIQYSLEAFHQTRKTEPESVPAVLIQNDQTLLTVHRNGHVPWPAVAREIAYAVKPLGEVGGLAGGIKEVLSSDTFEDATQILNELGYPPLQERTKDVIDSVGPVSMGGADLTAEEAVSGILGRGGPKRTDMPEEPRETLAGGGAVGSGADKDRKSKGKPRGKLRTYVVSEDSEMKGEPDTAAAEHRLEVDKSGIQRVLGYERAQGRTPTEMPHHNEGYDVESLDAKGQIRYIEVKSLSGDWGGRNAAGLTDAQFNFGREKGNQFWLYVVERARDDDYRIHCIQDPANQVNQYLFDNGWEALADTYRIESNPES